MTRPKRIDEPGMWHHVMNRGIAKRMLFEVRHDMQDFCSLLGESVERGEIEVHAFALMGNHYHLLVRSVAGELGVALQRIQTGYSRKFNRERRRDGPLMRGRYQDKVIGSLAHRRAVVSYIDRNPVSAGLVPKPGDYPYGSARAYLHPNEKSFDWLERSWIEEVVSQSTDEGVFTPDGYSEVFGRAPEALSRVIEAQWRGKAHPELDDLVRASPRRVQSWMQYKAQLADGTSIGAVLVDFEAVHAAVDMARAELEKPWRIGRRDAWCLVSAGLERELCGATLADIGLHASVSVTAAQRRVRDHRRLLLSSGEYLARSADVAHRALALWR